VRVFNFEQQQRLRVRPGARFEPGAGRQPGRGRVRLTDPRILAVGTANPPWRYTQEEVYRLAGYRNSRIRDIFLNSDIEHRHLYIDASTFRPDETPDELNARYLRGAQEVGCRAVRACLDAGRLRSSDVDLFLICSCTGYVCPDVGTRLAGHLKFRADLERGPMVGLGCAGALPTLQRAWDYAKARPGRRALMLAVEICSASYFIDGSLETVVGNALCGDGAAAFILSTDGPGDARLPAVVDFQSFLDPAQLDKVGFGQREGKLRIILDASIRDLAAGLIERSLAPLLARNGLRASDIRFWVAHPGGRKVIDNVERELGLTPDHLRFSRKVLREYGNMSSATVMFVLDEVARAGEPRPGDWGVMVALGPGMAAETALLRW
jgi:predicted naringenin-chalcone synthase